jgi:predicted nucleic-acid-binding protein
MLNADEQQSSLAQAELAAAELVAIALPSLCELVWVLSQGYKIAFDEIADAVRRLTNAAKVVVNRPAIEAGPGAPGCWGRLRRWRDCVRGAMAGWRNVRVI